MRDWRLFLWWARSIFATFFLLCSIWVPFWAFWQYELDKTWMGIPAVLTGLIVFFLALMWFGAAISIPPQLELDDDAT